MTEEAKLRAAADLADAVYFLRGHSKPVAHGAISTANAGQSCDRTIAVIEACLPISL